MKNTLLGLALMSLTLQVQAHPSEDIKFWKEVTPKKGYILSMDLQNEQHCLKIWSKQIPEFRKKNPHIKNPNKIAINKKIWVQTCRETLTEITKNSQFKNLPREKKKEILNNWFVGISTGYHALGKGKNDTDKDGYNIGVKFGYNFQKKGQTVSVSAGFLKSQLITKKRENPLGAYKVDSNLLTIETNWLFDMGSKFKIGPMVTFLGGEDVSFNETDGKQNIGAFGGANFLYSLSKKIQIEINVQQRIDYLDRLDLMSNLGLRYDF